MSSLESLRRYRQEPNVQAFLQVIRHGETSHDNSAYYTVVGGSTVSDLSQHPRKMVWIPQYGVFSSAAGAYQFLWRTWKGLVDAYGFTDFQPESQDLGAVALILGRKALDDLVEGRFETALRKCSLEWASLPTSPYGQRTMSLEEAKRVYVQYGGKFAAQQTKPLLPSNVAKKESPMDFIELATRALGAAIPELAKLVDQSDKKAPLMNAAVNIAKEALGAKNEQEVAEAMKAPEQVAAVREALRSRWVDLVEVGGGPEAASKRGIEVQKTPGGLMKNPAWAFTLLAFPLVYFVVVAVVGNFGSEGYGTGKWDSDIQSMVVASIISGLLGSLGGFWVGTSFSSSKKDELLTRK